MTKLDELRTFFDPTITEAEFGHAAGLPVAFLRILPGRLGEDCTEHVRDLLAEAARLEAMNETLTERFKSIDSSLGSAMDHVDQDAKRISALEAENARLRAEVGFEERLRAMDPKP